MLPVVAIVGRPNVGKSAIFNRIVGTRLSIVDDFYGVTRDRIYSEATWRGKHFKLIDTGGIEIKNTSFQTEIKAQVEIAISEASVIVFVMDIRSSINDDDIKIAKMLYASKKPVILALNKADNKELSDLSYEFYSLGFSDMVPVSGIHSIGIGDLLDKIIENLPETDEEKIDENVVRLAVIGRPNVGKSSLVNAILNEDRVIVSPTEGTTTDSIDTEFTKDNQKYIVIDTAGMRKRGKIYENVEKYSVLRAFEAIDRANICLVVIDAEKGIIENDKHIAGYAEEAGKGIIIVVNKWDLVEKDQNTISEWNKKIKQEFKFIDYAPIVYVSSLSRKRINTVFPEINKVFININKRVQTSLLNDTLVDAVLLNPPKEYNGVQLRIYYASEVSVNPPTFVLFVNDTECMHFSYGRYLENKLRDTFDFTGTPIKLILRKRS